MFDHRNLCHYLCVLIHALQGSKAYLRERQGFEFALLLVTDVVRGTSRLVTAGPERLLDGLPYPRRVDGTLDAPGVVSRTAGFS